MVKLEQFNLDNLYLMDLEVVIDEVAVSKINGYLK